MAGVEIDADRLADRVAQSEEGADTVDILVAVQFEAELPYAEASGISDKVPPIRDQHLFPLVAQDLLCLGRPARRHPIGVGNFFAPPPTAPTTTTPSPPPTT